MLVTDRRTVLRGMGIMGAAAIIPGCSGGGDAAPAATGKFFERIGKPIGLQLYAMGEEVGADLPGTLAAVKAMGYGEVELPNTYGKDPAEIKAMADAAGIAIACLHVPAVPFDRSRDGLTFQSDPDAVAAVARGLGITRLVIPFPVLPEGFAPQPDEPFPVAIERALAGTGIDHWQRVAERFNQIGSEMKDRDIELGYHNHNLEFAPLGDTTPFAVLMDETDPDLVKLQLDLGWVAQAGLDPAQVLREQGSRVTSLHVKDVAEGGANSFYFNATPTEVGSGRLDWKTILPLAAELGVQHYFVEQEPPYTIPRAEAMAKSARFLQALEA
ncbi:sugar phosphate isomerase/epimerase family protein [Alteraurantiacibacter buctensis]|uniref:TIM barrel protein n=1 Tax=Alteraurantiacibacter buctensis TaxID=1503981 RepID=A0A844YU95_9SPHN|nr:sugar phosphate isomerase/epimerase [Alteraurantiacibacter buctensis]MXO71905.1 TIM barrel protein [Alteraurantiacibacter buctensis]